MAGEQNIGGDQVKFDKAERTAESTAEDSVIAGDRKHDHQRRRQEMEKSGLNFQGMNKLGQKDGVKPDHESVTIVALTESGEIKASGKTGLNEKDLEQAAMSASLGRTVTAAESTQEQLKAAQNPPGSIGDSTRILVSNLTPNVQPRQFDEGQTDAGSQTAINTDAAHISHSPFDHTQIESGEVLRPAMEAGANMDRKVIEGAVVDVIENQYLPVFPYRGLEDSKLAECTEANPNAWRDALSALPGLKEVGLSTNHLKAVVRNELHWYDSADAHADSKPESARRTSTLGYSQISTKGIDEFARDIPEFKDFLKEKGYKVPGDEAKVLEDPACVPMIVAAKMASLVKSYNAYNRNHPDQIVNINPRSLIYGYNADVQALNTNGKISYESMPDRVAEAKRLLGFDLRKVYPSSDTRVLNTSNHVILLAI